MPQITPETPLAFVDLETTGPNFARDRILEIGVVTVGPGGVEEWNTLIDPGVNISPFITGLTGIDDTMVVGAPAFARVAEEFRKRLEGHVFIAHNARFDYGFVKAEFARLGIEFRAPVLCTVKLSRRLYPKAGRHNLDTLIERHAIACEGARHRALTDAQVLWQLWQVWSRELGNEALEAAISGQIRPISLPEGMSPDLVDELPETHGAYALRDEAGVILQTGRGSNLRSKVLSLFADGRTQKAPASLVRRIDWTPAAGEFGARLAEIGYLREAKPPAELPCAWRLDEHAPGDFRTVLVTCDEELFGRADNLYGLYATAREARQALRKIAEAHFLCPRILGLDVEKTSNAGKPCAAVRSGKCRGACGGREPMSKHSARLMTALARLKIQVWPFPGPVAVTERDEFGMVEDLHLFDEWRHLGCVKHEEQLHELLENTRITRFDSDVYRCFLKYFQGQRLKVTTLPEPVRSPVR